MSRLQGEEPLHGHDKSFHVIVLSGGGGPLEDDVTGFLVRSVATGWVKNAILAVDAGVHLAAIVRSINDHLPRAVRHNPQSGVAVTPDGAEKPLPQAYRLAHPTSIPGYFSPVADSPRGTRPGSPFDASKPKLCLTTGPFRGLMLPFETAKANAVHLVRHFISTYLITHPHLDHLAGFVVNTAAFQHTTRPKKLAALPHTIDAIKAHVFNDAVWPNLTDEEGGAGLVSYQRLAEGGNLALGEGAGRGYVELCEGLAVRAFTVSHGACVKRSSNGFSGYEFPDRRGSRSSVPPSPDLRRRSLQSDAPDTCVVDSSAFFIRDEPTGRELLLFGDVEPDSVSRWPRTARVWAEAAPKIARDSLKAVFIECSYDDSQSDDTLFGHLAPRHLIAELGSLADMVVAAREGRHTIGTPERKRKRDDEERPGRAARPSLLRRAARSSVSPTSQDESELRLQMPPRYTASPLNDVAVAGDGNMPSNGTSEAPLKGLRVVVIHVKDTLTDGPPAAEIILQQLREHEALAGLGCEISIARKGEALWL